MNLKIIIASTRPGRKGPFIAQWIYEQAKQYSDFQTELIDLKQTGLPFFDEPEHPRLEKYTHQHTMDWSAKIRPADAFIIVTPEYNHGYVAPLKNAFDFLYNEWSYKPIAFVSYGGVAAGTRAVQMLRLVSVAFKMAPLTTSVNIPSFQKFLDDKNNFNADEELNKSAQHMLKELHKWTKLFIEFRAQEKIGKTGK